MSSTESESIHSAFFGEKLKQENKININESESSSVESKKKNVKAHRSTIKVAELQQEIENLGTPLIVCLNREQYLLGTLKNVSSSDQENDKIKKSELMRESLSIYGNGQASKVFQNLLESLERNLSSYLHICGKTSETKMEEELTLSNDKFEDAFIIRREERGIADNEKFATILKSLIIPLSSLILSPVAATRVMDNYPQYQNKSSISSFTMSGSRLLVYCRTLKCIEIISRLTGPFLIDENPVFYIDIVLQLVIDMSILMGKGQSSTNSSKGMKNKTSSSQNGNASPSSSCTFSQEEFSQSGSPFTRLEVVEQIASITSCLQQLFLCGVGINFQKQKDLDRKKKISKNVLHEKWSPVVISLTKALKGGLIAQCTMNLLDISSPKNCKYIDRSIRCNILSCIASLVMLVPSPHIWRSFYPGIATNLVKILVGDYDYKQGKGIVVEAINLLSLVTSIVFHDDIMIDIMIDYFKQRRGDELCGEVEAKNTSSQSDCKGDELKLNSLQKFLTFQEMIKKNNQKIVTEDCDQKSDIKEELRSIISFDINTYTSDLYRGNIHMESMKYTFSLLQYLTFETKEAGRSIHIPLSFNNWFLNVYPRLYQVLSLILKSCRKHPHYLAREALLRALKMMNENCSLLLRYSPSLKENKKNGNDDLENTGSNSDVLLLDFFDSIIGMQFDPQESIRVQSQNTIGKLLQWKDTLMSIQDELYANASKQGVSVAEVDTITSKYFVKHSHILESLSQGALRRIETAAQVAIASSDDVQLRNILNQAAGYIKVFVLKKLPINFSNDENLKLEVDNEYFENKNYGVMLNFPTFLDEPQSMIRLVKGFISLLDVQSSSTIASAVFVPFSNILQPSNFSFFESEASMSSEENASCNSLDIGRKTPHYTENRCGRVRIPFTHLLDGSNSSHHSIKRVIYAMGCLFMDYSITESLSTSTHAGYITSPGTQALFTWTDFIVKRLLRERKRQQAYKSFPRPALTNEEKFHDEDEREHNIPIETRKEQTNKWKAKNTQNRHLKWVHQRIGLVYILKLLLEGIYLRIQDERCTSPINDHQNELSEEKLYTHRRRDQNKKDIYQKNVAASLAHFINVLAIGKETIDISIGTNKPKAKKESKRHINAGKDGKGKSEARRNHVINESAWNLPTSSSQEINLSFAELQGNAILCSLLIECVGVYALVLGDSFRKFLSQVLYPLLEKLGDDHPVVRTSAFTTLSIISYNCVYLQNKEDKLLDANGTIDKVSDFESSPNHIAALVNNNIDYILDTLVRNFRTNPSLVKLGLVRAFINHSFSNSTESKNYNRLSFPSPSTCLTVENFHTTHKAVTGNYALLRDMSSAILEVIDSHLLSTSTSIYELQPNESKLVNVELDNESQMILHSFEREENQKQLLLVIKELVQHLNVKVTSSSLLSRTIEAEKETNSNLISNSRSRAIGEVDSLSNTINIDTYEANSVSALSYWSNKTLCDIGADIDTETYFLKDNYSSKGEKIENIEEEKCHFSSLSDLRTFFLSTRLNSDNEITPKVNVSDEDSDDLNSNEETYDTKLKEIAASFGYGDGVDKVLQEENIEEELDELNRDRIREEELKEEEDKANEEEKILLNLLDRASYFLSMKNLTFQYLSLSILEEGFKKLYYGGRRTILLPLIHRLWPSLMRRFLESAKIVHASAKVRSKYTNIFNNKYAGTKQISSGELFSILDKSSPLTGGESSKLLSGSNPKGPTQITSKTSTKVTTNPSGYQGVHMEESLQQLSKYYTLLVHLLDLTRVLVQISHDYFSLKFVEELWPILKSLLNTCSQWRESHNYYTGPCTSKYSTTFYRRREQNFIVACLKCLISVMSTPQAYSYASSLIIEIHRTVFPFLFYRVTSESEITVEHLRQLEDDPGKELIRDTSPTIHGTSLEFLENSEEKKVCFYLYTCMIRLDSDSLWPLLQDLKLSSLAFESSKFPSLRNSMPIDRCIVQLLLDQIDSFPETVFLPLENSATAASRTFKYKQDNGDEKTSNQKPSDLTDDLDMEKLEKELNDSGKQNMIQELTKGLFSNDPENEAPPSNGFSTLSKGFSKNQHDALHGENGFLEQLKCLGLQHNRYDSTTEIPN